MDQALQDLAECAKDGEYGFRTSAEHMKAGTVSRPGSRRSRCSTSGIACVWMGVGVE